AALGVAEEADSNARRGLGRRHELDPRTLMLAAENVVDLAACRALLSRAAALVDEQYELSPGVPPRGDDLINLFAEAQAAKTFIGEAAVRIGDRALALSGGAGYHNGRPVARV